MARGLKYHKGAGKFRVRGHRAMRKNSGYLRKGRDFFPSHAPIWWSYTDAFTSKGAINKGFITVGDIVKKKLEGRDNNRMASYRDSWHNSQLIENIEVIRNAAKKEEQAFLNKYNITIDPNNWSELIKYFTILFTSEDAFMRNLQILNQVQDKQQDTNIYHNFTALISGYVQKASQDVVDKYKGTLTTTSNLNGLMNKMMDEIIELALNRMFRMTDLKLKNGYIETNHYRQQKLDGEELQAFRYLLDKINVFMNSPFKDLVKKDLGLTEDFITKMFKAKWNNTAKNQQAGKKRIPLPKLKNSVRNGQVRGSVQEHFENIFVDEAMKKLQGTIGNNTLWCTYETGGLGAKTDILGHNLLASVTGYIPDISLLTSTAGASDSKRINAINNSETFFRLLHEAEGDIVFVSDKNYQIKSEGFDGYSAQDDITLENLKLLLNKVHYPGDVDQLYGYLSNCGKGMLLGTGKSSEVLNGVATYIGHFLFDDLTITGSISGINRVHLLNLSGFYLPLSVYLDALLEAAKSSQQEVSQYASAHFYGHGKPPQEHGWSGSGDFDTFRQTRLDESRIEIKFMTNIAEFITSKVKI